MNEKVRVHLNTAILVGYGREARYAKVLIGEREPIADIAYPAAQMGLASFIIFGYVRNYEGFNLAEPTRLRLSISNILAIEDMKVESRREPYYMRRAAVYLGTPDSLWAGPRFRQVSLRDVERARRIIQLRDDGRYRIVKNMDQPERFSPRNEVIFLYDEEGQ